jgi:hypothetical protein
MSSGVRHDARVGLPELGVVDREVAAVLRIRVGVTGPGVFRTGEHPCRLGLVALGYVTVVLPGENGELSGLLAEGDPGDDRRGEGEHGQR